MESPPAIDLHDPLQRYQLVTVAKVGGKDQAFIKDLLEGDARLVKVGETFGDCKLIAINLRTKSARLKPTDGAEFTIKVGRSGGVR